MLNGSQESVAQQMRTNPTQEVQHRFETEFHSAPLGLEEDSDRHMIAMPRMGIIRLVVIEKLTTELQNCSCILAHILIGSLIQDTFAVVSAETSEIRSRLYTTCPSIMGDALV